MLSNLSSIIYLAAWTIDIPILKRKQYDRKYEYEATLKLKDDGWLDWQFKSTSKIEVSPGQICKGIILGHDLGGHFAGPAILVIGKVNDTMERIGLDWVNEYNCKWARDKDGEVVDKVCHSWEFAGKVFHFWKNAKLPKPLELAKSWEEIRLG